MSLRTISATLVKQAARLTHPAATQAKSLNTWTPLRAASDFDTFATTTLPEEDESKVQWRPLIVGFGEQNQEEAEVSYFQQMMHVLTNQD